MRSLALLLLLALPAAAQEAPPPRDEELDWAESVQRAVPAAEIEAAAAAAEARQSSDPLVELAGRYGLQAPAWLRDRIEQQAGALTVAALGDSVTAATAACDFPYLFCPRDSWVVGDAPASLKSALRGQSGRPVRGLLVAVPTLTMRAAPAEAFVVFLASYFGLNVERMTLLMGHNDPGVCGEDEPGALAAFERDYATTLRILARVHRRRGAKLFVSAPLEVPALARYPDLVPAGASKTCRELWAQTGRCRRLLEHRDDPARVAEAAARLAAYREILDRGAAGRGWVLYTDALHAGTRGGLPDPAAAFSRHDCFHPSARGQALMGAMAWNGAAGSPGIASFFALPGAAPAAPPGLAAALERPLVFLD